MIRTSDREYKTVENAVSHDQIIRWKETGKLHSNTCHNRH